jgi:hypothetical protein
MHGAMLLDPAEVARVVPPMIVQFFLMAAYWFGALGGGPADGPDRAGTSRWPHLLLPLLMVTTGLLFFSAPLEPVWRPFVGAELPPALPAAAALALVLALNLGVAGIVVAGTGGLHGSPFLPLLCAIPGMAWILGSGGAGLAIAATSGLIVAALLPGMRSGASEDRFRPRSRFRVAVVLVAAVAVAVGLAR